MRTLILRFPLPLRVMIPMSSLVFFFGLLPSKSYALFGVGDVVYDPISDANNCMNWVSQLQNMGQQISQFQTMNGSLSGSGGILDFVTRQNTRLGDPSLFSSWQSLLRPTTLGFTSNLLGKLFNGLTAQYGVRISGNTPTNPVYVAMIRGRAQLMGMQQNAGSGSILANPIGANGQPVTDPSQMTLASMNDACGKYDAGVLQEMDATDSLITQAQQNSQSNEQAISDNQMAGPEAYLEQMIKQNDTLIAIAQQDLRIKRLQEERAQAQATMDSTMKTLANPAAQQTIVDHAGDTQMVLTAASAMQ